MLAGLSPAAANDGAGYQPVQYDLRELPSYLPEERAVGVLRVYGSPMDELVGRLTQAFKRIHPQTRLDAALVNTSQGIAGLSTGRGTVGIIGHRAWLTSQMGFERQFGYRPLEIRFANGSFDDPAGSTPGIVFVVHESNPINGLTLEQIDGIFGAQRTGGWVDGKWTTESARSAEENIRRWGQLGLTGEWADKPIRLYGTDITISNWAELIERIAFGGGTKWNPAITEFPRGDISVKAEGTNRDVVIVEAVHNDPYSIGFTFQRVVDANPLDIKVLPIAPVKGEPFVTPSAQTFFEGRYPFVNSPYIYLNRPPGEPIRTIEREFMRFVLSREGQQIIADSRRYMPLNATQVRQERNKLD